MRILVEEEYGYRHWIWDIKESSIEGVRDYFTSVVEVENFYCSGVPSDHFVGEWCQVDYDTYKNLATEQNGDAWAHIHTDDDSNIRFYNEPPVRNIQ
tara:strand:+ start:93 stop:383 length:291 start_codon:yes stop_codon:yes gene_type:complete